MTERSETMRLGEIATVRSGLVLSRKQATEKTDYRYKLLNLRSLTPDGINIADTDVFDATEPLNFEYLSHEGDVIVRLSAPYTAIVVDSSTEGMVISSNFVIIRPEKKFILPEYLFWLLNTPKVKREIYENTSSNMLGAIKAKYFSEFEVSLLPIEEQRKISDFYMLSKKEKKLMLQLTEEKEKLYSMVLNKAQKNMRREKR